jgi:hypothetical protein
VQPCQLPRQQPRQPETLLQEVDSRLRQLDAARGGWAGLDCAGRAALLRQCLDSAIQVGRGGRAGFVGCAATPSACACMHACARRGGRPAGSDGAGSDSAAPVVHGLVEAQREARRPNSRT